MATTVEPSIAWWKRAVDVITNVIVSPRVRWVATVGIVGLVFFSLTMSLIPQAPPDGNEPPPLPIKRDNPPMGGIG